MKRLIVAWTLWTLGPAAFPQNLTITELQRPTSAIDAPPKAFSINADGVVAGEATVKLADKVTY